LLSLPIAGSVRSLPFGRLLVYFDRGKLLV